MNSPSEEWSPVIVICAARSGSKLLRSILYASGDFSSCPYDANYVWKYGNYELGHDELSLEDSSKPKVQRIRGFFDKVCQDDGGGRLLEKTVSNSLRVEFVKHVYPNAKFIHLYRSGCSAVNSTIMCWKDGATSERIQSKEDRLRKLREFPFLMAWPYLLQYLMGYAKKKVLRQEYVESWGPRYEGIDEDVKRLDIAEVCARQWAACVHRSVDALSELTVGKDYINVCYEDLISDPASEIRRIAHFADIQGEQAAIKYAYEVIDPERAKPDRYSALTLTAKASKNVREAESALQQLIQRERMVNNDE